MNDMVPIGSASFVTETRVRAGLTATPTRFLSGLDNYWDLSGIRVATCFFSRLPTILPRDAVLVLVQSAITLAF